MNILNLIGEYNTCKMWYIPLYDLYEEVDDISLLNLESYGPIVWNELSICDSEGRCDTYYSVTKGEYDGLSKIVSMQKHYKNEALKLINGSGNLRNDLEKVVNKLFPHTWIQNF